MLELMVVEVLCS